MDKIVVLIANKFISNIYKCKKLPSIAYQQLHMDIIELKDTLLKVVNADQSNNCLIYRNIWKSKK